MKGIQRFFLILAMVSQVAFAIETISEKTGHSPKSEVEPRIALVIGNASYPTSPLINTKNDAKAISEALKKLGFEVSTLTDQRRSETLRAVRSFSEKLKANNAIGLFYFAGHGMQFRGKNFVIPVDAYIRSQDEVDEQGVDVQFIVDRMGSAGSSSLILILDACRNNPFLQPGARDVSGLAAIDGPPGTLIAFSAAPGKTALDGDGENSPYTKRLVEVLSTPGIPIEEVFKRVRVGVLSDTDKQQVPWENTALTRDFYFRPSISNANVSPEKSVLAPLSEDVHWAEIKNSRSIYDYVSYYQKFPNSGRTKEIVGRVNVLLELNKLPTVLESELPIFAANSGYIGAESKPVNKYMAEYFGLGSPRGILITNVKSDSVAEKTGLLAGDIVLKVNGQDVPQFASFVEVRNWFIQTIRPGEYITGVVWRDKKEITLTGVAERPTVRQMLSILAGDRLIAKDYYRVREILEPLAKQQDRQAQAVLGLMYARGMGGDVDLARATLNSRAAAEGKERLGAYILGLGYLAGKGVEKNDSEAFKWLKVAADAGLQEAIGAISLLYISGRGTQKDFEKAFLFAKVASGLGESNGMLAMGVLHEYGAGVQKDIEKAKEFYKQAADLNNSVARNALLRLDPSRFDRYRN